MIYDIKMQIIKTSLVLSITLWDEVDHIYKKIELYA